MNKQARQLVENISDQYVLLAADPAQAFAAAEQKKKKNRAKIFAIAAAAAAMYIIITVSLIIGALTPPDDPVAPPDDGPGTQDPDDYFQDDPEVQLPESGTFVRYLKNYWLPTWTTVDDPDSLAQSTSPYTVYNFQPDGRVHIIDVNGTSSTGKIGKYSFSDNTIEIWTKGQDGWKKSDLTITLQINETYYNTTMTVTEGEKSTVYIRPECTDEHVEFWNVDDERPVESTDNYYIESIMLSGMSSPISFEVPGLEYFKQLNVFHFSAPPALQTAHINSVSYKIYNEALELVAEGSSRMDANSLSSCALKFPDEPGLYYIDVATSSHEASDIFQQLITHFYAAIQIGEEKVDEPVTPPTPPAPEINLPDEPYLDEIQCANEVYGTWTDGDWMAGEAKEIFYHFTPGGYFYQMNTKTWESVMGVYYYYADGTILMFEADEQGNPIRQMPCYGISSGENRGVITMHSLEDNSTLGTYTLGSTYPSSELLHVRTKTSSYFIPYMLPEAFIWDADHRFEFDTSFFLDKIQTMPHISITEAPSFYIPLVGQSVTYTLYVKEDGDDSLEIISEDMLLDQGAKLVLPDLPESYWEEPDVCYYLDIRYETGGYNAYCNKQFMHYFVALKCLGDEEESYSPPEATEDSVLIESCNTQPQGAFELDTTSPAEGEGCWSITTPAAGALAFHAWETGIDASGRDVIEFDLYISDLEALKSMKRMCALELSSSGKSDVQEIAFSGEQIVEFGRYGQEWQVGWNHVVLRLADATATNGKDKVPFDISNVNFVRFYLLTATDSHTIKIDNICLSVEQK